LSAASNVGDLSGPPLQIDGAEVTQLSQDVQRKIDNGIARQEITLRYAVFAQSPGTLDIPMLTFSGSEGGSASIFSNRNRQVVARTQAKTIIVQQTPSPSPKPWLIADELKITSEWVGDVTKLRVGEPITRRISITANGQKAEAIPPLLTASASDYYQSYQDQAQLQTTTDSSGVMGVRTESEAIIVNAEGKLVLPEQKLSFWSARSGQIETAILPTQTLDVLPAVVSTAIPNQVKSAEAKQAQAMTGTSVTSAQQQTNFSSLDLHLWQWACVILSIVCIAQALYIYLSATTRNVTTKSPTLNSLASATEKEAWSDLLKQLKLHNKNFANNNPTNVSDVRALRIAVQNWGTIVLGNSTSLDSIATKLSNDSAAQLKMIDRLAFADAPESKLDVAILSKDLSILRKTLTLGEASNTRVVTGRPSQPLPKLYPTA
jgi:hypothetical protein